MRLGLSPGVGGILIEGLGLGHGLDLSLDIGMSRGMNADSVVNIIPSCCQYIFSEPFTIISLSTFINSPVMKFDELGIIYTERKLSNKVF